MPHHLPTETHLYPPVPPPLYHHLAFEDLPATSDLRIPNRWLAFTPEVQAWIRDVKSKWPLKPAVWADALPPDYPDSEFLLHLFSHGLAILPPDDRPPPYDLPNYGSTREHEAQISVQMRADFSRGRILSPPPPLASAYVHPLGAIPKPPGTTVRIIHNLSAPLHYSVNDNVTYKPCKWASLDDAFALMTEGCFLARVDIEEYYRHIPVDPADWDLTAFRWLFPGEELPTELWEPFLPFGLRQAPEVAHRVTTAILAIMRYRGYSGIVGVMDDFLVVADTEAECRRTWLALIALLEHLGFPVNKKPHKTVPPATCQIFLGVELDSTSMEARLGADKLQRTLALLTAFHHRRRATRRDIESLSGLLTWVCRVVYGGRTFLRRVLDLQHSVASRHHRLRLTRAFQADITWWLANLHAFNGKAVILPARFTEPREFQTDAELNCGVGVYFAADAYCGLTRAELEREFSDVPPPGCHISVYETYAVLVAVRRFPALARGRHLCVRSDNSQTVAAVNKGSTGAGISGADTMRVLRALFSESCRLGFRLTARHIPGVVNSLADALSRQDWPRFHALNAAAAGA